MAFRLDGKKRITAGLTGLAVLLLALSACGSGSEGGASQSPAGAAAGPVREVTVSMGDFFYQPNVITVESGKIKFVLTNVGATAHRFSIQGGGVTESSRNVGAGRDGLLEVELPPGTYKIGCTLGDHEARGSVGQLIVQ